MPGLDALRCLGGRHAGPVDGRSDEVAVDPLERLADRHDRDRGPVVRRPRGRPPRWSAPVTSGRAPSWTSRTRSSGDVGQGPADARGDRCLAPIAARHDGVDLGRQPVRRRQRLDPIRRCASRRSARPRARRRTRPASRPGAGARRRRASSLSVPAIRAEPPGRHHDDVRACVATLNRVAAGRRSSCRRPSGGRASPTRRRPCRCGASRPRPRSSCRRRGTRRPGRAPCPPG